MEFVLTGHPNSWGAVTAISSSEEFEKEVAGIANEDEGGACISPGQVCYYNRRSRILVTVQEPLSKKERDDFNTRMALGL